MLGTEFVAEGRGNGVKIVWVAGDDEVVATECSFDNEGVDDVTGAGACGHGSDGLGAGGCGHGGDFAADEEGAVPCPHLALASFGGYECAGVVGDAHQRIRLERDKEITMNSLAT